MSNEQLLKIIEDTVSDAITDFLYYDRKEDYQLGRGAIEQAIQDGVLTREDLIEMFRKHLIEGLGD